MIKNVLLFYAIVISQTIINIPEHYYLGDEPCLSPDGNWIIISKSESWKDTNITGLDTFTYYINQQKLALFNITNETYHDFYNSIDSNVTLKHSNHTYYYYTGTSVDFRGWFADSKNIIYKLSTKYGDTLNPFDETKYFKMDLSSYMTNSEKMGKVALNNNVLSKTYPNPFNPLATIEVDIKQQQHIRIEIIDCKGMLVHVPFDGIMRVGLHSIIWNGKNKNGTSLSSGTYFFQVVSENSTSTKKMLLLK